MKTYPFQFLILYFSFIGYGYALEEKNLYGQIDSFKEGDFKYINSAKLGAPTRFFSEVDDITCHKLIIKNQTVGWIFHAFKTESKLLLYKCEIFEGEPFISNSKYGGRDSTAIYTAIKNNNKWSLSTIPIPNYDNFSNHSICNDNVAYWGTINNSHFASVYNLKEMRVIKKVELPAFELRTDNEGFFPEPIWSKDCGKITYPKYYGAKTETVIDMRK